MPATAPRPRMSVDRTAAFLWYTLSVIPQSQARVCQRAREIGIETYVPMSRTPPMVRKFGRKRVTEAEVRPLMPGYVFVSLSGLNAPFGIFDPRHGSEALRGSLGFISCEQGPESQRWPMAISEAVIEDMRLRERNGEFDLTGLSDDGRHRVPKWAKRDSIVQFIHGPFESFYGRVVKALSTILVEVEANIFGRKSKVCVPLDWVRLAPKA